MSHELREGVKIKSVAFSDTEEGGLFYKVRQLGDGKTVWDVVSITVKEQAGQAAMIPWAEIIKFDGSVSLVNLAQCEEVELLYTN